MKYCTVGHFWLFYIDIYEHLRTVFNGVSVIAEAKSSFLGLAALPRVSITCKGVASAELVAAALEEVS